MQVVGSGRHRVRTSIVLDHGDYLDQHKACGVAALDRKVSKAAGSLLVTKFRNHVLKSACLVGYRCHGSWILSALTPGGAWRKPFHAKHCFFHPPEGHDEKPPACSQEPMQPRRIFWQYR